MPVAKLVSLPLMPFRSYFDASVAVCSVDDPTFTANGKRKTRFHVIDETIDAPVEAKLWDEQVSFAVGELVYINATVNEYNGKLSLNVNRAPRRIVAADDRRSVDLAPWWQANRDVHIKVAPCAVTTIGAVVDGASQHDSPVHCLAFVAGVDNVSVTLKGKPCVEMTLEDATGRALAIYYPQPTNYVDPTSIRAGSVLRLNRAKVDVYGEKRTIRIFGIDASDGAVDSGRPRGAADVAFWKWVEENRAGGCATGQAACRLTVKEVLEKKLPVGKEDFAMLGNVVVKHIDKDRSTTKGGGWKRLLGVTDASAPDEVFDVVLFGRATEAEIAEGDVVNLTIIKVSANSMTGKSQGFLKSGIPLQVSDLALAEACASSKRRKVSASASGGGAAGGAVGEAAAATATALTTGTGEPADDAGSAESEVDLTPDIEKAHLLAIGTRVAAKRVAGKVLLGMLYLSGAEKRVLVEVPEEAVSFEDLEALSGAPLEVSLSGRIVQRGVVSVSTKKEISLFPLD